MEKQKSAEAILARLVPSEGPNEMSGRGPEARVKTVQQKLLFEDGGHGPDRERNSRRGCVVQQVHPAPRESKATSAPLMNEVVQEETLARAWKAVRRNRGGPGTDGVTIDAFASWWGDNRQRIADELLAGTYKPQPVKRCEIPKAKGGVRVLGVPTVLDRVVQQAIVQVLTPTFDPGFSEHSYVSCAAQIGPGTPHCSGLMGSRAHGLRLASRPHDVQG